jgi:hypothetical protein
LRFLIDTNQVVEINSEVLLGDDAFKKMRAAVIVSAQRLPTGKFLGSLKAFPATQLGAMAVTVQTSGGEPYDDKMALVVGLGVLAGLGYLIGGAFHGAEIHPVHTTTEQIGNSIFHNFVLPFEVVSMLLLAALIGAVVLARKEDPKE